MPNHDPLLKVQFDGEAVGAARIPVAHLLRFLDSMSKALHRTGRVLRGDADSLRRGAPLASITSEVDLELVQLTHGSPSAVLGFERRKAQQEIPGADFGNEVLETALIALAGSQEASEALPHGVDTGVLTAWRDAGILFNKGISRIQFTLNHRECPLVTEFTPKGYERIQEKIQGPETNMRTIEGRLLMADFREDGTRCRIHPSASQPILCLFNDEQRDEVYDNLLHFVRIVGEAKEDPVTGKISTVRIHDIQRVEELESLQTELLPKGTPLTYSFWESPSLPELAAAQGVQAITDVSTLLGGWPGDADDGFEDEITKIRHSGMIGADC